MTTIITKYPFVGSIDTRQGGRNENQDNAGFVDTPLGLLVVVCDGMGGGPGGRTASLIAVDTVLSVLSDVSEHTPRIDALRFAIAKANDMVYLKAKDTPELRGMGTTIAAILINEDSAVIAHVGDTRVYQLRKGTIVFRSSDHSLVANLVRQKKLTEEEARNHHQSNVVTRALGIRPEVEVDFDEVPFLTGDRFVLCTDGIWGMMPQRDLVSALSRAMGLGDMTALLTEEIDNIGKKNGGDHDNMTIALIDPSFDSRVKKIRKKVSDKATLVQNTTNQNNVKKSTVVFSIICVALLFLVVVVLCFVYSSADDVQMEDVEKGPTTTTVDRIHAVANNDSTDKKQRLQESFNKHHGKNKCEPTQNSVVLKAIEDPISRPIDNVVLNLDSLKKINGKKKKEGEDNRRSYVNKVIIPNVDNIKKKVVDAKRKNVDEVVKMLKRKKTVSCSSDGKATKESNNHIEEIKIKVKALKN